MTRAFLVELELLALCLSGPMVEDRVPSLLPGHQQASRYHDLFVLKLSGSLNSSVKLRKYIVSTSKVPQ